MTDLLTWPVAIIIVVAIVMIVGTAGTPATRRHKLQIEELRAKGNEQYQVLAADYAKLATELRDTQTAMQADLARLAASVESMEVMMREVG